MLMLAVRAAEDLLLVLLVLLGAGVLDAFVAEDDAMTTAVDVMTCAVAELAGWLEEIPLDEVELALLLDVVEVVVETVPFGVPVVRLAASLRVETSGIVVAALDAELVIDPARLAKPTAAGLYRYTE